MRMAPSAAAHTTAESGCHPWRHWLHAIETSLQHLFLSMEPPPVCIHGAPTSLLEQLAPPTTVRHFWHQRGSEGFRGLYTPKPSRVANHRTIILVTSWYQELIDTRGKSYIEANSFGLKTWPGGIMKVPYLSTSTKVSFARIT